MMHAAVLGGIIRVVKRLFKQLLVWGIILTAVYLVYRFLTLGF